MASPESLRYAVLLDRPELARWQARCLREMNAVEGVRPAAVVMSDDGSRAREDPAEARRPEGFRHRMRRRVWRALERRLSPPDGALAPVGLDEVLPQVPVVRGRSGLEDVDLALRFGSDPLPDGLLDAARFGVWAFRHGARSVRLRGDGGGSALPFGVREILAGETVAECTLERLRPDSGRREVLHRGRFRVVDDSWRQTRDAALLGAAGFAARVCREIRTGADPSATPIRVSCPDGDPDAPSMGTALHLVGVLAWNYLRNAAAELVRHEQWTIGVVPRAPEAFLEGDERLWIRWIPSTSSGFYRADPFGVQEDGVLRILAEEFRYGEGRGRLVALDVTRDGRPVVRGGDGDGGDGAGGADGGPEAPGGSGAASSPGEPVELPWDEADGAPPHVSYPYLLRHEGVTYCVPETAEARVVALYRARRFPGEWERVTTLIEGFPALDPTVFRHEGRWWLFCTEGVPGGGQYRLHGWWAPELTGPWTPHALNPLKVDVRSARPAGTPFRHRGGLYRPAQDGSGGYGSGVALNRVLELTPTCFREVVVAYLTPDPDGPFPDGLHTLSGVGDRTLVDGLRKVFIADEFRRRLARRLRGLGLRARRIAARARRLGRRLLAGRDGSGEEAPDGAVSGRGEPDGGKGAPGEGGGAPRPGSPELSRSPARWRRRSGGSDGDGGSDATPGEARRATG